jgi:hypothetical protein
MNEALQTLETDAIKTAVDVEKLAQQVADAAWAKLSAKVSDPASRLIDAAETDLQKAWKAVLADGGAVLRYLGRSTGSTAIGGTALLGAWHVVHTLLHLL